MDPKAAGLVDLNSEEGRDKLARLFRYAEIGRCINSVTHDVNNYLGAIMAYAELVGLEQGMPSESHRMINEIINAVRRSSDLLNNLTDVARRDRTDVRIVNPAQLVKRAIDLRLYDLKVSQISLTTQFSDDPVTMSVDLPKLQQTLIYLINNAIEALEQATDRRLIVGTAQVREGLEISVWNSGEPFEDACKQRMFEPFFTTKNDGHLGLGLFVAQQTALLHDGDLTYDAERGFVLYLPRENSFTSAPTAS